VNLDLFVMFFKNGCCPFQLLMRASCYRCLHASGLLQSSCM
jgi:hypothetical protein